MTTYKKLTIAQVKALARKEESVRLYVFPSNCGPSNTSWLQGGLVDVFMQDNGLYYINEHDERVPFLSYINHFRHYNCSKELGYRIHYYIEVPEILGTCENCGTSLTTGNTSVVSLARDICQTCEHNR